ncbi:putative baseplate assembly protein [Kitasatospora sp. NPDC001660]
MNAPLRCDDERRRAAVRARGLAGLTGVTPSADGRSLTVALFGTVPDGLDRHSFRVEGGRRVTGIQVVSVSRAEPNSGDELTPFLHLALDRRGDGSAYRLRALGAGFDARYACQEFTFRPAPPDDLDCAPGRDDCPPRLRPEPALDHLAKDYASFRRLLLERLALTMPGWTERHAPDLGITLVELLAHVGDQLSYFQDAVATEAYLDTARLRTSVRRHARLVDYPMHDGCAARAFVLVETAAQITLEPGDIGFTAAPPSGFPQTGPVIDAGELARSRMPVFHPLQQHEIVLRPEHNRISLWTWGDRACCLPVGATEATLLDEVVGAGARADHDGYGDDDDNGQRPARPLRLAPGDILVFEEVLGPVTGALADADPEHRQAVRLTRVTESIDALYDTRVLEIAWAAEDALTFPLCVTAPGSPDREVSVARGNAVLVEHGTWNSWAPGTAPEQLRVPAADGPAAPIARAFTPVLAGTPVTRTAPYPRPAELSAAQARQLARLPDLIRDRLRDMKHSGTPLTASDRRLLSTLLPAGRRSRYRPDDDPGRTVATLLARFDEILDTRLRRLEVLVRRARSGRILDPADIGWELAHTWGEEAAASVDPRNPALHGPARDAVRTDPRAALPDVRIRVEGTADDQHPWQIRRDLLASRPRDRHMVGETDDDGLLRLRFGDGRCGAVPPPGTTLLAAYRTGNGRAGNVGSGAVNRIASRTTGLEAVLGVRNPLPATGGTDPEPVADVRLAAPREPFRKLLRAVTAEDYATLAGRLRGVQRAAAALRWTGSWYEADVTVDAIGRSDVPRPLLEEIRHELRRYRRIGHDVVTGPALQVPLDVALDVTVDPDHITGHVHRALLLALRPGRLPGGGLGFFDPDALTFGTPVRASRLVALAVGVPGVRHAEVTRLRRLHDTAEGVPASGVLRLRPEEIARLDDDAAHPENGRLTLNLRGGR